MDSKNWVLTMSSPGNFGGVDTTVLGSRANVAAEAQLETLVNGQWMRLDSVNLRLGRAGVRTLPIDAGQLFGLITDARTLLGFAREWAEANPTHPGARPMRGLIARIESGAATVSDSPPKEA
jgi:hypothetical protein